MYLFKLQNSNCGGGKLMSSPGTLPPQFPFFLIIAILIFLFVINKRGESNNLKKSKVKKMNDEKIDFFINEIKEKILLQYEEAKAPITKASILVAFIPVFIGILFSLKYYGMIVKEIFFAFNLLLLLLAFFFSFLVAFMPIFSFRRDPKPDYFVNEFYKKDKSLNKTKEWLLEHLVISYNKNKKVIIREQLLLIFAGIFLIFSLIQLLLSIYG